MKIGYARVSTENQNESLQLDALTNAGCEKIFSDTMSGSFDQRQGLNEAIHFARAGDTICVWRLDRLGRSVRHLVTLVNELNSKGIQLQSLKEEINTSTPGGKLFFHLTAAIAEFEKDLVSERTRAGLLAARKRGRIGGRPASLSEQQIRIAKHMLQQPGSTKAEIAKALNTSRATLYRLLSKI